MSTKDPLEGLSSWRTSQGLVQKKTQVSPVQGSDADHQDFMEDTKPQTRNNIDKVLSRENRTIKMTAFRRTNFDNEEKERIKFT